MKKHSVTITAFLFTLATIITLQQPLSAAVNDDDTSFLLRGGMGGGRILWAYVNHGSSSGDLGTGNGVTMNLSGMFSYRKLGFEGSLLAGTISDLEWSDEDNSNPPQKHTWKSSGSGHYTILDLKIGARLFTEPGDMGYTYFYGGFRIWSTERNEETLTYDGTELNYQNDYEADGRGWLLGFRDFSTIGANNGFAIVIQSGFYFGKAPLKTVTRNGVDQTLAVNDSILIGGELAGGVALQDRGISIIGGGRGEIMLTTFHDEAAPTNEESVFGFGNIVFFVEAGIMF